MYTIYIIYTPMLSMYYYIHSHYWGSNPPGRRGPCSTERTTISRWAMPDILSIICITGTACITGVSVLYRWWRGRGLERWCYAIAGGGAGLGGIDSLVHTYEAKCIYTCKMRWVMCTYVWEYRVYNGCVRWAVPVGCLGTPFAIGWPHECAMP